MTFFKHLFDYLNLLYWQYPARRAYIRYQLVSSCNIYVIIAFIFFVILQLIFWPIYVTFYLFMLLFNGYRIYKYVYTPSLLEVASVEWFYCSSYVWVNFIYNITYRRAHVNSFSTLYRVLKLWKGSTVLDRGILFKLIIYIKTLLFFLFILSWNLITGIPWLIISRSFQYSKAFRFLRDESLFDPLLMRQLVINNYQTKELLPGINYRLYKANGSVWNFNPKPFNQLSYTQAYLLSAKIQKDYVFASTHYQLEDTMRVACVKAPDTNVFHFSIMIDKLWRNNIEYCLINNLTSNPQYNPNLVSFGTPAKKNPQTINHAELARYSSLEFENSPNWSGFQLIANKLSLLQLMLVYSIIFNSDGTSSLAVYPLYEHLTKCGISFDSDTKRTFIEAGRYTDDLRQFITRNKLTELDLKITKYLVLSEMCPSLANYITSYEFTDKANTPLILPNSELIL